MTRAIVEGSQRPMLVRVEHAPAHEVAVPCGSTPRINARDIERTVNASLDLAHRIRWRAFSPLRVVGVCLRESRVRPRLYDAHGRVVTA